MMLDKMSLLYSILVDCMKRLLKENIMVMDELDQ